MNPDIQNLLKYGTRNPNPTLWCKKCNVPLIQDKCEVCKKQGISLSKSFLKPVFKEELQFIKKQSRSQSKWFSLPDLSLWSAKRNYYYNGEKIFTTVGLTNGNPLEIKFKKYNTQLPKRILRPETIISRLKKSNQPSLNRLEYHAIEFIESAVKTFHGRLPIVSFSGGKDSCAVSYLVRLTLGSKIIHIFGDTTIEYPDTYKFIERFKKDNPMVPFLTTKPMKDFFELAEEIGPPSRILRWCCTTHKTVPIGNLMASLDGNGVLTFDGIRKTESLRRSKYVSVTIKQKIGHQVLVSPIIDWNDTELWLYMLTRGINFCDAYRSGFARVGCLYCPFNMGQAEYLVHTKYKDHSKKWNNLLESFAKNIGYEDLVKFKNYGWKARAGARGLEKNPTAINKNECFENKDAYNYELLDWKEQFFEYLKPFGILSKIYDDGIIANYNVVNSKTNEVLFFIRISRPRKHVRVILFTSKNKKLLLTRIDSQIKRFQSCILCGQCQNLCKFNASYQNDVYFIDQNNCINCMECVKKECLAVKTLKRSKQHNATS